MEGRPRTNPEQDRVLAQGRSSGECQRLKSNIYFKFNRLCNDPTLIEISYATGNKRLTYSSSS